MIFLLLCPTSLNFLNYYYYWLCWVFVVAISFSPVVVHGLSCPDAYGISTPQPGVEHPSPALQGGFLTPEPPGQFLHPFFKSTVREWVRHCP